MKPDPYWQSPSKSSRSQLESHHYYLLFSEQPDSSFNELVHHFPDIYFHKRSSRCFHIASPEELNIEFDAHTELCKAPDRLCEKPLLASFDMDSTLITAEVIDELAREAGCYENVAAITASAMRGELDFSQSLIKRVACLQGLSVTLLEKVYQRLTLSQGAQQLLTNLNHYNTHTMILSGGFDFFARGICQQLHMDAFHANQLEIKDSQLSGQVIEPIIDAEQKASIFEKIRNQHQIPKERTIAVGDGANDLKVMQKAGLGIAWHAKPAVNVRADIAITKLGLEMIATIWD